MPREDLRTPGAAARAVFPLLAAGGAAGQPRSLGRLVFGRQPLERPLGRPVYCCQPLELPLCQSLNLAKKPQAGYLEVGSTIDKACNFSSSHTVDVVCGDLNRARWSKSLPDDQAAAWHEGTLGELERRGYIPVADYSDECCFVAVHDSIAQSLHIKGSSWAERTKTLNLDQRAALTPFLYPPPLPFSSYSLVNHFPTVALQSASTRSALFTLRPSPAGGVSSRGGWCAQRGHHHAHLRRPRVASAKGQRQGPRAKGQGKRLGGSSSGSNCSKKKG